MKKLELNDHTFLTRHAHRRMSERAIKKWQVDQVLAYGRTSYNRNVVIYAVGRKEVKANGKFLEPCEGLQVLCSPQDGSIITAYRNHNLSSLRH